MLADALPYFRDFNQKIIVIGYLCSNILSGEEEQGVMQDIALLKSVGMKPIIVHDARMGADKFRENKRVAKLVELCGVKAVGICGIDEQTLHMTLENDYIPVVTPNDIDTENINLDPIDTAREIAVRMQAEKLIYVSKYEGARWSDENKKILSMKESELRTYLEQQQMEQDLRRKLENAILALDGGVRRIHFISGRMKHALLLELFSVLGIGTVVSRDDGELYEHEYGRR
ncbi:MAG: acetylglutamate kinase [Lachnospiraceae bacterium]|nr:acetylglutamate kinase [Lachnospiraceae bacterium]